MEYLDTLVQIFLDRVEKEDNRDWQSKHEGKALYWKEVPTYRIASEMGVPTNKARRELKKLEKLGYVTANRSYSNSTSWSTKIEGFEQHMYKDYYVKVEL